jgi:hypothetical protein
MVAAMRGVRGRQAAALTVAVAVAVVFCMLASTGPTALLTRGELNKAVRGCKWWYAPIFIRSFRPADSWPGTVQVCRS